MKMRRRSSPWSDVGFAWCSQSPYMPVWRRSLLGTPNCCLRARTSDSLVEEAPPGGVLIFTSGCLIPRTPVNKGKKRKGQGVLAPAPPLLGSLWAPSHGGGGHYVLVDAKEVGRIVLVL